jgi:hypothetical protein
LLEVGGMRSEGKRNLLPQTSSEALLLPLT